MKEPPDALSGPAENVPEASPPEEEAGCNAPEADDCALLTIDGDLDGAEEVSRNSPYAVQRLCCKIDCGH